MLGCGGRKSAETATHFIFIAGSLLKRRPEVMGKAEKAAGRGREGECTRWGQAGKECAGFSIQLFTQQIIFEHAMCPVLA